MSRTRSTTATRCGGRRSRSARVFSTALPTPSTLRCSSSTIRCPGSPTRPTSTRRSVPSGDAAGVAGVPAAVTSVLPESFPEAAREAMLAHGVCPLQGLDDAFAALAACARLGERPGPAPYPAVVEPPADAVPIGERAAKELLEPYGVVVPEGRLVPADEAAAAAQALGFPVAVKLASPDLAHKAASGAVALGLRDCAEVAEAVEAMLARNPAARSRRRPRRADDRGRGVRAARRGAARPGIRARPLCRQRRARWSSWSRTRDPCCRRSSGTTSRRRSARCASGRGSGTQTSRPRRGCHPGRRPPRRGARE